MVHHAYDSRPGRRLTWLVTGYKPVTLWGSRMPHWQMILYGAAGGAMVSMMTLYKHLQMRNQWPWKVKNGPTKSIYYTGEAIRIILGAGVAWGLAATDQLGLFGAIMVGAGAPAILDKWQRAAPGLAMTHNATAADTPQQPGISDPGATSLTVGRAAIEEGGS